MARHWVHTELQSLSNRHAHIARAVERAGVPIFKTLRADFGTLVNLIIQQQVSVAAARSIKKRLDELLPGVQADAVLSARDADLRAVGLSAQKVKYIRDLSQYVSDGRLDVAALEKLDDAEITARLTRVKGIGRWTAENYMIFALQRRNIWPAHDLALQEGMRKLRKLKARPTPKEMDILGARYTPHRTAAALFGWHYHEGMKFNS